MPTTLVTWNLKGSGNPDAAAVADHIRAEGADIVVLQEVQWHQAERIARAIGARSRRWSFKHWPLRTWPEGMAVVGVTRSVRVRTRALSHRWLLLSWRRRIVQVGDVAGAGDEGPFRLVNLHLTPHGQVELRGAEVARVVTIVASRRRPTVVAGDLNERPGGALHAQLAAAGLRDAWSEVPAPTGGPGPDGPGARRPDPWPTNWRGWRPGTTEPPTQQLDYVYVSPAVAVLAARVPRWGDAGFSRFSSLSDHLPVSVTISMAGGSG